MITFRYLRGRRGRSPGLPRFSMIREREAGPEGAKGTEATYRVGLSLAMIHSKRESRMLITMYDDGCAALFHH